MSINLFLNVLSNSVFLNVGFSDERNSMWRELCNSSLSQLSDPYLRATFGFLTGESDSYDKVLVS